jgi:GNAT superfamily N-acetyltransferase
MRSTAGIADLLSTASTIGRLGPYEITDDPDRVSVDVVHDFLSRHSPGRRGVTVEQVDVSVRMSLPLSAHLATCTPSLVGFVRVVTDTVSHSWLEDLFVLREHRRRGIAAALVSAALRHPSVAGTTTVVESFPVIRGLLIGQGFRPIAVSGALMVRPDAAPTRDRPRQVHDRPGPDDVGALSPPPDGGPAPRAGQDSSRGASDERHQP